MRICGKHFQKGGRKLWVTSQHLRLQICFWTRTLRTECEHNLLNKVQMHNTIPFRMPHTGILITKVINPLHQIFLRLCLITFLGFFSLQLSICLAFVFTCTTGHSSYISLSTDTSRLRCTELSRSVENRGVPFQQQPELSAWSHLPKTCETQKTARDPQAWDGK